MKQINKHTNTQNKLKKPYKKRKKQNHHLPFGTSKLEMDFATNFLDRLGVEYQWQFEAKDIHRYFDFFCPKENIILEVNGDYW